ncbi:helix-turn-helix domain-containing protein [Mycobacterium malmoense]|uniref:PucR family transcriptional regulator n=1 Tax=Mycobacterium malmoense TaxID=1780 RepID=UPI0009F5E599|nr:helix-turn-helix domain-containing protein [Mycobacterium malmoense]QZA17142.1 helix-turn-helix domain-containing protein [Mycobacterium malmoense]UNB93933.1 helix-turn-helix domain-containing protein [Mycobacterium malmoense]
MGTDSGYGGNQTLEKPRPASGDEGAPASSDGVDGDVFVAALLGEQTELARRVREAIQLEIPVYRSMAGEALDIEVGRELRPLLRSGCSKRALTDRERIKLDALGEQQARQGVPIDDVLRAWRIGIETVVGYAREVGQRRGIAEARVLEFVQSVLAWSDLAIIATTRAHRRAERAAARGSDECRANFVRGALLGTISRAELRVQAEIYGLDPAAEYVAVRARLGENLAQRKLERTLGLHDPAHGRCGLCALVNGDAAGFSSQAPPKDVDGVVGFGPPRPLDHLAESYRSAARALVTAEACGLQGAHDIASLGLRPAVALDVEVGELLRRRYLDPLGAASSVGELIATLRAYLACGMHVERTATRLFVHQNTVRYRIARFEELTGTSLGDTEVLLEVWWALELSAMHL